MKRSEMRGPSVNLPGPGLLGACYLAHSMSWDGFVIDKELGKVGNLSVHIIYTVIRWLAWGVYS